MVERLFALVALERLVEADLALFAVYLNFVPGRGVFALLPIGTGPSVWFFAVLIGIVGVGPDALWRLIFGWVVIVVGGGCRAFRGLRNIVPFFRPAICNSPLLLEQAGVSPAVAGVAAFVAFGLARLEDRLRGGARGDELPRLIARARGLGDLLGERLARLVKALRHCGRSAGRRRGNR